MKLRIKSIITLVTMLLTGIGAFAQDGANSSPQYTVSYQYDGEASTSDATGIVECTFNGTTATIVCKPVEGNYITAEDIIVEKTVSGDKAQTREVGIDSTPITITAASTNTTPREQSAYTFTAEADPNLTYEITANFHQLKDLDTYALIALPDDAVYTYSGQEIKPEITVTASGVNLTAGTDYTVTYADNVNAGQGSITITATTTTFYTGSKTVNFDINQADVSFWFEKADGSEAKELSITYGETFTKPVLKMSEAGAADVIGVVYSVDNEEVATIDATTGELTILKAGTVVVTAAAAEDYTNKEGSNYKADPTNTKTSYSLTINTATPTLKFSKETAEATMGAEFEAPALTVTPEGLVPIEYESTNTEVATIDKNTGIVTLVGKGETTIKAVFPGNENYESALASYTLTIKQVKTELKYSTDKATVAMGAEFEAPTLTVSPEGLTGITYTSSNTNAATINAEGKVTLVGEGQTTIKASFAGNAIYEPAEASYTLTVEKGMGTGYALWIGDIQVTEDNKGNILGDENKTFTYNPEQKQIVITNNQDKTIAIESRMENLTIYLNSQEGQEGNKLKKIFYNNLGNAENKGNLKFIAFNNNTITPSTVVIENTDGESVISGFEKVELDQDSKVIVIEPENAEYKNGQMYYTAKNDDGTTTEKIASKMTIGQPMSTIDQIVTFNLYTAQVKDENGNPIYNLDGTPKMIDSKNVVVMDVLITLPNSGEVNSNEGFDQNNTDGRPGINIETVTMTDAKVKEIAKKVRGGLLIPTSESFADEYVGMTMLLPAGKGNITTELITDPGYEFHALIAEDENSEPFFVPIGAQQTPFDVKRTSFCYIYLVKSGASTRLGKREKVHGKVYSVGVSVTRSYDGMPPSEASGGALPQSDDPKVNEETAPTPPTGITFVNSDKLAVKSGWYTLDGQKIAEPKQRGLYIKDGKKVAIK